MRFWHVRTGTALLCAAVLLGGCEGPAGEDGEAGLHGAPGTPGEPGAPGTDGVDGVAGQDGTNGRDGEDGPPGPVAEAPRMERLFPAAGGASTQVTIHGSNFSSVAAENEVFFDGIRAEVLAASTSQLIVRPALAAAGSGRDVQVAVITNKQTSNPLLWTVTPPGTAIAGEHQALSSIAAIARTRDGVLWVADEGGLFRLDVASGSLAPLDAPAIEATGIVDLAVGPDEALWAARHAAETVPNGPDAGEAWPVVHVERFDLSAGRAERVVTVDGSEWTRFDVRSDGSILLLGSAGIAVIPPSGTVIGETMLAPEDVVLEDFILLDDVVFALGDGRVWRQAAEGGFEEIAAPVDGEPPFTAIGKLDARISVGSSAGFYDIFPVSGMRLPAAPPVTWVEPTALQPLPTGAIIWRTAELVGGASAHEAARLLAATAPAADFVADGDGVIWASPHLAYVGGLFRTSAEGTALIASLPHGARSIEQVVDGYVLAAPALGVVSHVSMITGAYAELYRLPAEAVTVLGSSVFLLSPAAEGMVVSRGTLLRDPLELTWGVVSKEAGAIFADDAGVWVGGSGGLSLVHDVVMGGEAEDIGSFSWVTNLARDVDGTLLVVQAGQIWRWKDGARPVLVNDGVARGPLPWEVDFSHAFPSEGGDYVASTGAGFVRVVR